MTMQQPGVPILGQQRPTHAMAQLAGLANGLDENGVMPLENGVLRREQQFMDGVDLVRAIRQVVKEELDDALRRHSLLEAAQPTGE